MAFPKTLVTRFFQLINNRQFTEAQRQLQRLKEEIQRTEWNNGYYRALAGLYHAGKGNGNNNTFLSTLKEENVEALEQHKNDFLKHIHKRFHDDFDRGFFSAWSDYTRLLIEVRREQKPEVESSGQTSIIQYSSVKESV
ncbi:hypothetical protein KAS06_03505 [Candidatus Bathyarchaeota archaeon]|nr:hypothetical protein [Candidatus Bathyarchaeota archaeon]